MNPQDIIAQGRTKLVAELNIGHLTEDEQTQILDRLGEVLTKRVMAKVLTMLPENEQQHLTTLIDAGQEEAAEALMNKFVPDLGKVVQDEVLAGIEEHKRLVNEAVAGQGGANAPQAVPAAPAMEMQPEMPAQGGSMPSAEEMRRDQSL